MGTATTPNPAGLGRIVRDPAGQFVAIVEEKDATPDQRAINEVNMSMYVFQPAPLLAALQQLTTNNLQDEYYLTDCPSVLKGLGQRVVALCVLEPCEALSINTPDELNIVETEMNKKRFSRAQQ
jgi:bifunctional N-acetylglucosamine-1-phosphate-uridyltransferase/glucosamine-1-phosphate-acetyltransferase GlmU-like protein